MAEVHILGNIKTAKGFPKQNLFCNWSFQFGNNWNLISGKAEGKTFCSSSEVDEVCYWNLPFDLHFAISGIIVIPGGPSVV
ncbi:B9 domain-containing protein 2 isoform X2 [Agrilus planipennis]|uniref:B9 domain-containing protein 2 n=1 Tax=Agrilus planipennis TaxID=224129 RepID=A0A1W4XSE8_AGRPL|nr:B9 domain-containing protein 2 isoform X2 [Agrilus planipennis]